MHRSLKALALAAAFVAAPASAATIFAMAAPSPQAQPVYAVFTGLAPAGAPGLLATLGGAFVGSVGEADGVFQAAPGDPFALPAEATLYDLTAEVAGPAIGIESGLAFPTP
jgi:hypothetical protein